jgi:hypothetical protein
MEQKFHINDIAFKAENMVNFFIRRKIVLITDSSGVFIVLPSRSPCPASAYQLYSTNQCSQPLSLNRGEQMNFHPEKGIERLKELLQTRYEQIPEELYIFEMRLAKNRRDARLFGDDDPANRSELNRILSELNRFALERVSIPFPDLCQDRFTSQPPSLNGQRPAKSEAPSDHLSSNPNSSYLGTRWRWAVLVGVGSYDDREYSELSVCVHDVTEIARQLYKNESDFTPQRIHVLVDDGIKPTRAAVLSCLQKVADAAEEDDTLLFYYSGHGELEQDEAYLVTRDSRSGRLKDTAVSVARVEEIMQASRAKAKVMILDACHAGANLRSKGSERLHPRFVERVYMHARGMAILASCEKNQKSYVWESKECSAYTYFLLEALRGKADRDAKGFVSVTDIDEYVTNGMASWTERHRYIQTPTMYLNGHGRIIVSFYKKLTEQAPQSEIPPQAAQPQRPKQPLLTPSPSWNESETVLIRGETYILYRPTVQEKPTRDRCAVLRSAQAQQASTGNMVQLKQVCIFRLTAQGNTLCKILKKEHRLAVSLAQYREFPRVLEEEEITGGPDISTLTLVYEAWKGPTLGEVFQQPGKALVEGEILSLLWCFIHICKVISILHREPYSQSRKSCSHRALTADTIILLGGDRQRPLLRDFGLAAYPATWDGKEAVQIQAPEQRYSTHELGIPDHRTDIYQLGVILYTLITGQPFSSSRPITHTPAIPPVVDDAIMRAVAFHPKDRWPTVMAFASEIKKVLRKDKHG